jgi:hypothetical protein
MPGARRLISDFSAQDEREQRRANAGSRDIALDVDALDNARGRTRRGRLGMHHRGRVRALFVP